MMRCPGLQKFDAGLLKCLPQVCFLVPLSIFIDITSKQYVQECIQTHKELGIQELKFATFEIKDIQEGLLHLHPIDAPFNASLSADFGEVFPFAPFVSSCIGIPDGKYARGCSEKFISCMNGRMKLHKCPSSLLKFDSTTQRCLPVVNFKFYLFIILKDLKKIKNMKACGGNYIASKLKPQKQLKKAISLQYPRLTCEKQADGKYATGCSPQFIECNRNEGSVFRCPGSLIFDAQTERCLPAVCSLLLFLSKKCN
ncbi:unnamed protein product [Thelazia callipaeda]|uniref:Chitin-binding type-2 domain-containing protein n=1 Tax=Thelazia callipaeda TaxID=103827 RepID=A0A0N5CYH7_THECL|nr:unnamed protein product [Thelazia callipaeda]